MKKFLLILGLVLTFSLGVSAQYVVHDLGGKVTLEKSGGSVAVTKGMKLSGADMLNIPEGGFVELLNSASNQLFRSTTHGRFATTRIMIDARAQASDNGGAIHRNIKNVAGSKKKQKVYNETGMVTRSLTALDPAVAAMNITSENLCECLVSAIRNNDYISRSDMPVSLTGRSTPEGGMKLNISSEYDYPVYFNVFKVRPGEKQVEVSELGQSIGNYKLGPNQSITREQFSGLEDGYRHIVLMTPVPFNLNGLLKDLENMMGNATVATPDKNLPVYIKALE